MEENKFRLKGLPLVFVILAGVAVVGLVAYLLGLKQVDITTPSPSPTSEATLKATTKATPVITATATSTTTSAPIITATPTITAAATATAEPKADLYISEYSFDHNPKMGEPFTVKIGIYNKGNKASTGFYWEWWPAGSAYHCRERIDSLAARGGRIVYCTYTYGGWTGSPGYPSKAVVDSNNEVMESDESNNSHTQNVMVIH